MPLGGGPYESLGGLDTKPGIGCHPSYLISGGVGGDPTPEGAPYCEEGLGGPYDECSFGGPYIGFGFGGSFKGGV